MSDAEWMMFFAADFMAAIFANRRASHHPISESSGRPGERRDP
jgi:hypothetical protein